MGYVFLPTQSLCIPRNSHVMIPSSLDQIYSHHDYSHHDSYDESSYSTSACHHLLSLYHSCVLLFYDYAITILMILTTHIFPYLSLTLPSLSLDLHSFDYSFLSHPCPFLLSLPHSLCNCSIFTYNVLSLELHSVMATLVYIV